MPQESKTGQLFAPNGLRIVGTRQVVDVIAIAHSFEENCVGSREVNYAGESDVDWNSQRDVFTERGTIKVVDEQGFEWGINQCKFVADADKSPVTERAV
jgi:hypothetical protein